MAVRRASTERVFQLKPCLISLAAGQTLEEFLDDFEGVSREQAEALLELAGSHLLEDLPKP